jgi:hypothetical protein
MSQLLVQIIVLLIRALLAAVLVAAGAAKLADTRSFAATVVGLGIPARRKRLVRGLALAIPLLEMGLGLGLVSGLWSTGINGAVFVLLGGFSLVVLIALRKAPNVACRCFGALSDSQFSRKGLARSLFLTALAAVVFWYGNTFSLQLNGASGSIVLLVMGYLVFAGVVAQAAKTLGIIKERLSS